MSQCSEKKRIRGEGSYGNFLEKKKLWRFVSVLHAVFPSFMSHGPGLSNGWYLDYEDVTLLMARLQT